MSWLRRSGDRPRDPEPEMEEAASAVEAAAPGIAALLDGVREDGSHAILDLGAGAASTLEVYGRFARVIRFADVPAQLRSEAGKGTVTGMLEALRSQHGRPYDLIFAWDVLDRLFPEYRDPLVERLVEITAPGSRLHLVVRASEKETPPLRFGLLGTDRMRYEPVGPPQYDRSRLLPAEVAALVEPFQVIHGFTLKGGLREYVAVRGPD